MASKITCLVTLHGIGFEQPPQVVEGVEVANSGYADPLHQHLYKYLDTMLSDDPGRVKDRTQPGENGPIYVQSHYRDAHKRVTREEGLKRLGVWGKDKQRIDITDAPLVADGSSDGCVSHVALVYSNLEPMKSEVGATLLTLESTLASSSHYGSALGLLHMAVTDGLAIIGHHAPQEQQPVSSRPRVDLPTRAVKHLGLHGKALPAPPPGVLAAVRNLEDDVACYVCYNEERERVRGFVFEALMRLGCRRDVEHIVLNTHSNGTVVAFDVLRNLPQTVTDKIKVFVTAGSPLRKYVDLFHWGHKIESLYPFRPWYNFWDRHDPVADPLNPPYTWRVGDAIVPSDETLFQCVDLNTEEPFWINVEDMPVDNINNSHGGGLQAHNYWDNEEDFVQWLATFLKQVDADPIGKAAQPECDVHADFQPFDRIASLSIRIGFTEYRPGKLEKLLDFYSHPGYISHKVHVFVARDLEWDPLDLEDGEELFVQTLTIDEALAETRRAYRVDPEAALALWIYASKSHTTKSHHE